MVESLPELKRFDPDNHGHLALLLLLCRVRMFVREQRETLPRALSVFIDEGPIKAGDIRARTSDRHIRVDPQSTRPPLPTLATANLAGINNAQ
jgi:hypothetical protein